MPTGTGPIADIRRGLNEADVPWWRRVRRAVEWVEQFMQQPERYELPKLERFPAFIAGYQLLTGGPVHRAKYLFRRARWDPVGFEDTPPIGLYVEDPNPFGSDLGDPMAGPFAYNRVENGNDGLLIENGGLNVDGSAFPRDPNDQLPTFFWQPIQGDWLPGGDPGQPASTQTWALVHAPVVEITVERAVDGSVHYAFDGWNHFDGTCPPEQLP